MPDLIKRPIVIQDLINIATYISYDNLEAGDRFLYAAEATFQLIAKNPGIGRISRFKHPKIAQVRQYPIKGFKTTSSSTNSQKLRSISFASSTAHAM